jgi:S-formylglutathione hydrolase FrmB
MSLRPNLTRPGIVALAAFAVLSWVAAGAVTGGVDRRGARVEHFEIDSKAVGKRLPVSVVIPSGAPAAGKRPLLVFLHGRGEHQNAFVNRDLFEAIAGLGSRAPIIAFPYGGDHSYWHDRAGGRWGAYVIREVIPGVVRRFGARADRVAIGGISMGGFGAYDLARTHPGRFCAVGGHSPALWEGAGLTAPGAFDNGGDFARHDVIRSARAHAGPFKTQPVWLDAGTRDPFRPGDTAFVAALRSARAPLTERTWPGGHDQRYRNSHWNAYLRFYANALNGC